MLIDKLHHLYKQLATSEAERVNALWINRANAFIITCNNHNYTRNVRTQMYEITTMNNFIRDVKTEFNIQ